MGLPAIINNARDFVENIRYDIQQATPLRRIALLTATVAAATIGLGLVAAALFLLAPYVIGGAAIAGIVLGLTVFTYAFPVTVALVVYKCIIPQNHHFPIMAPLTQAQA